MLRQYPHQETLAAITMLAPSLALFRCVQMTHSVFHVTPQQQFKVRQRWRYVSVEPHERDLSIWHAYMLPHQRLDGLVVRCVDHRYRGYGCYINGNKIGEHRTYWRCGALDNKYTYVNGKRHGTHWSWFQSVGNRTQLYQRITYEHGRVCTGVRFGPGGNILDRW